MFTLCFRGMDTLLGVEPSQNLFLAFYKESTTKGKNLLLMNKLQWTPVISISPISNNRLSRNKNLVLALIWKLNNR